MMYQFKSSTLFNCFFTSWSENLQDSCDELLKYFSLYSTHDKLNFMIILHLFLCLCQWYNHIFYLLDKTSTAFAECFSEINYTLDLSNFWEVLSRVFLCTVTKSMS